MAVDAARLARETYRSRSIPILAGGVAAAAGAGLAVVSPGPEAALVAGIVLACAVPLAARLARRRLDVFEPLFVACVALLVMYAVRPAALLAGRHADVFKGYDIGATRREALAVALVGVLALQVGYALPWARGLAQRFPVPRGSWDVQMTVVFAGAVTAAALGLFAIFLVQAGGLHVVTSLVGGRSNAQESWYRDSSAYFYGAPQMIWPASLLLVALGLSTRRRGFVVAGALTMIPLAIFAGGQGARIILIPLLATPVVFAYLVRRRRPRPLAVAVAAYLLLTVGIAYFRETRSAADHVSRTAELQRSLADPRYELDQLVFHGTDNDMFESLAVELRVVPERLSPSPLDFAYRTLAKPIPSILWHSKPVPPEERLAHTLYPQETERASSSAGVVGSFYLAGGVPGVIVGMLLVGVLFRVPWEYVRKAPESSAAQLFLACSLMFVPVLLRGGVGDTIARALFGFVPLLVAMRICLKESRT